MTGTMCLAEEPFFGQNKNKTENPAQDGMLEKVSGLCWIFLIVRRYASLPAGCQAAAKVCFTLLAWNVRMKRKGLYEMPGGVQKQHQKGMGQV